MRQASKRILESVEKTVRDIRRATRRHHSAEEKIRIVLEEKVGDQSYWWNSRRARSVGHWRRSGSRDRRSTTGTVVTRRAG